MDRENKEVEMKENTTLALIFMLSKELVFGAWWKPEEMNFALFHMNRSVVKSVLL